MFSVSKNCVLLCKMDADSSFNLEIRIVAPNARGRWYSLDMVVDADRTNFRDLFGSVVDKCPPTHGDVARMFYLCLDSKLHIEVCKDQDLVEMFAKNKASKCCYLTFAYTSPTSEPQLPDWEFGDNAHSVQAPVTPSVHCPSIAEPSKNT